MQIRQSFFREFRNHRDSIQRYSKASKRCPKRWFGCKGWTWKGWDRFK